jgi:hypothetical protein
MRRRREEERLVILLDYYNLFVDRISPIKKLRPRKNIPFSENYYYDDLKKLEYVIKVLNTTPQKYLEFQFRKWRAPFRLARQFPALSYLSSPVAIEKYIRSLGPSEENLVDNLAMLTFSAKHMQDLMSANNISSEEEFFKDPLFLSEVSEEFLSSNETFMELLNSGYYENTFGLTINDILPSKELHVTR